MEIYKQVNEYLNLISFLLTSTDLRLIALKLGISDPLNDPEKMNELMDAATKLRERAKQAEEDQLAQRKKAEAEAKRKGNILKAILAALTLIIILIVILLFLLFLR